MILVVVVLGLGLLLLGFLIGYTLCQRKSKRESKRQEKQRKKDVILEGKDLLELLQDNERE